MITEIGEQNTLTGPYLIKKRFAKYYSILIKGKTQPLPETSTKTTITTLSERKVRFPDRF